MYISHWSVYLHSIPWLCYFCWPFIIAQDHWDCSWVEISVMLKTLQKRFFSLLCHHKTVRVWIRMTVVLWRNDALQFFHNVDVLAVNFYNSCPSFPLSQACVLDQVTLHNFAWADIHGITLGWSRLKIIENGCIRNICHISLLQYRVNLLSVSLYYLLQRNAQVELSCPRVSMCKLWLWKP